MKKRIVLFLLSVLAVCSLASAQDVSKKDMLAKLYQAAHAEGLRIVSADTTLQVSPKLEDLYSYKILLMLEQPIDHNNPALGTFEQQVVLMHVNCASPMVQVTEGYTGRGAAPGYNNELSTMFRTNMVEVEHRYFGRSVPHIAKFKLKDSTDAMWKAEDGTPVSMENLNWDYMTAKQAAADHHNVNRLLKHIYTGKWIATGISKGGQTAMFYTAYYPQDMDISVPYVGPVCRAVNDGRHQPFLKDQVATEKDRSIIYEFQKAVLNRRQSMEKLLEAKAAKEHWEFKVPVSEVLDMTVLEFPFAFWQWGRKTRSIPSLENLTDEAMFDYLQMVAGSDYFAKDKQSSPFYVQAVKELGYYGYDTEPFKGLLSIKNADDYMKRIMLPTTQEFKFDSYLCNDINAFLEKTGNRMMFIYGLWDPWSSVMPQAPVVNEQLKAKGEGRQSMILYINTQEQGHRARILNLPAADMTQAIITLGGWLGISAR